MSVLAPTAVRALLLAGVSALAIACGATPAPDPRPAPERPAAVDLRSTTLDNGLRLITRRHVGTAAVLQLWLPAGVVHDPADHPGLSAYAAEALGWSLQGTLDPFGARVTAWTGLTASAITIRVAAEHRDEALRALARAVRAVPDGPARRGAAGRLRQLDAAQRRDPERSRLRRVLADVWPESAYSRPLLPTGPAATLDQPLGGHLAARWRPGGAALVVVGPFDLAQVRPVASAAFDEWQGQAPPVRVSPRRGADALRPLVLVDPASDGATVVTLAWPITVDRSTAAARWDALALALADGPQALAARALQRRGLDGANATARVFAPGADGLLILTLVGPPSGADALLDAGLDAVRSLGARSVPQPALLAARQRMAAAEAHTRTDAAAHAHAAGHAFMRWGAAEVEAAQLVLDGADLARMARERLTADALVALVQAPGDGELDASLRGEQLAERIRRGAKAPAVDARGLAGIELTVVERAEAPRTAITVHAPAGSGAAPEAMAGVAELVAAMLEAPLSGGERPRTRLTIDGLRISLSLPTDRAEAGLVALSERLMAPVIESEAVEAGRAQTRAERRADRRRLSSRAADLVAALAAAEAGHAPPGDDAVDAGLESLTPGRIAAWFDAFISHAPLRITVVGGLSEARVQSALAVAFTADRPVAAMQPIRVAPSANPAASASPDAAQTPRSAPVRRVERGVEGPRAGYALAVPLGHMNDADAAAIAVVAEVLAAPLGPDEDPLFTDGAVQLSAGTHGSHERGLLVVTASGPAPAVARAEAALERRLSRMVQIALPPTVFDAAARRLLGATAVALADPAAEAGWLDAMANQGRSFRGPRALDQWRSAVERARPSGVADAARRHLAEAPRYRAWVGPIGDRSAGQPPTTAR